MRCDKGVLGRKSRKKRKHGRTMMQGRGRSGRKLMHGRSVTLLNVPMGHVPVPGGQC